MLRMFAKTMMGALAVLLLASVSIAQTTALSLPIGEVVSGTLDGVPQVYTLTAEAGSVLMVEMKGLGDETSLRIDTPEGFTYVDDAYYGIDREQARVGFLAKTGGEYRVTAGSSYGTGGDYTLLVTRIEPTTSAQLTFGTLFHNVVGNLQTQLAFTLEADTVVAVDLEAPSYSIGVLLLDSSGETVTQGDTYTRVVAALPAGSYIVAVQPSFGRASDLDNPFYSLRLSAIDGVKLEIGETATADATGKSLAAFFFDAKQDDVVNISLTTGRAYTLSFILRDASGAEVGYGDTSGSDPVIRRWVVPADGTYRIDATPYTSTFEAPVTATIERTESLVLSPESSAKISYTSELQFEVLSAQFEGGKTYTIMLKAQDATRYYDIYVMDDSTNAQVASVSISGSAGVALTFAPATSGRHTLIVRGSYFYAGEEASVEISLSVAE